VFWHQQAILILSKMGRLTKQRLVRANATAYPESAGDAALNENARWHRGLLWLPDLDQNEGDQKQKGEHKQRNNTPLAPLDSVSSANPKRENKVMWKEIQARDSQHTWCHPIVRPDTGRRLREGGQVGRVH
jgi:hypothetical protein